MPTIVEEPAWLTVKETARRLGLHPLTVRRKIKAGELPALQLGGRGCAVRIFEDELASWLEEHRNSGEAAYEGKQPGGSA
jgi:excisionase family DNA binding protein